MTLIDWWKMLNLALQKRGEPLALYTEALDWYRYRPNWRNLSPSTPRIINEIISARKPQ